MEQPVPASLETDAASEQLLGSLLDLVERCQRDMSDLRVEELHADCLSALTALAGGGVALLLLADGDGRLRLELASDDLPLAAEALRLDLADIARQRDLPPAARIEALAAAVGDLLAGQVPGRDLFVHGLADGERIAGVLVQLSAPGQTFDVLLRERLQRLSGVIHQLLRAADQFRLLLQRSAIDPLTGLYNERYFASRLRAELSRASRHGHALGLLFFDLDDFQGCRRAWGPQVTELVLRQVADLLRSADQIPGASFCFRRSDVPVRHGGEEFVVLLPETPKWGVLTKAERLRKTIEGLPLPGANGSGARHLTASIGVAAFPEDASDAASLVEAALKAMGRAKQAGHNRVEPA